MNEQLRQKVNQSQLDIHRQRIIAESRATELSQQVSSLRRQNEALANTLKEKREKLE